jgi:hypothetical protein
MVRTVEAPKPMMSTATMTRPILAVSGTRVTGRAPPCRKEGSTKAPGEQTCRHTT